jgi:hypothetical protein
MKYISALACIWIVAVHGTSHARELYSYYNGNHCGPRSGKEAGDFYYGIGGIKNTSGAPRWVSCPIVNHEGFEIDVTTQVWVYTSPYGTFRCDFYHMYSNGVVATHYSYNTTNPVYPLYAILGSGGGG